MKAKIQSSKLKVQKSNKDKVKKVVSKVEKVTSEHKKSSTKKTILAKDKTRSKDVKAPRLRSGSARSMEELLANAAQTVHGLKQGQVVEGVVTEISKKMVLVDIGAKTEGMVVDREYEGAYELVKDMHVGDKIKAIVISPENDRGQLLLSLRKAASERSWEHFEELMNTDAVVIVRGLEVNKGGLIARADNMRGFIPSSQFGKGLVGKMEELINRPIKVKVIEVDKEKNRLIFSERHVSEAQVMEKKTDALEHIKAGDTLSGTVSGVMPFGAFVTVVVVPKDKPGEAIEVDGLVHISEISWEKVDDPNKFFKVGQKTEVKVLSIDKEAGKLNLSVKRLGKDPWDGIAKRYALGSKQTGTVTRVEPFGAFVNFEPGVDGLIHISKILAGEEPKGGDKIDVFVETVDQEHRRMSLSLVHTTTEKLIYK